MKHTKTQNKILLVIILIWSFSISISYSEEMTFVQGVVRSSDIKKKILKNPAANINYVFPEEENILKKDTAQSEKIALFTYEAKNSDSDNKENNDKKNKIDSILKEYNAKNNNRITSKKQVQSKVIEKKENIFEIMVRYIKELFDRVFNIEKSLEIIFVRLDDIEMMVGEKKETKKEKIKITEEVEVEKIQDEIIITEPEKIGDPTEEEQEENPVENTENNSEEVVEEETQEELVAEETVEVTEEIKETSLEEPKSNEQETVEESGEVTGENTEPKNTENITKESVAENLESTKDTETAI